MIIMILLELFPPFIVFRLGIFSHLILSDPETDCFPFCLHSKCLNITRNRNRKTRTLWTIVDLPLFYHNVFCFLLAQKKVRSTSHVECFLDMIDQDSLSASFSPGDSETNGIPPPLFTSSTFDPMTISIVIYKYTCFYVQMLICLYPFLTVKLPESTNMRRIWVSPLLGAGDPHPNKSGRQTGFRHGRVLVKLAKIMRFPKQHRTSCFHHTGVSNLFQIQKHLSVFHVFFFFWVGPLQRNLAPAGQRQVLLE